MFVGFSPDVMPPVGAFQPDVDGLVIDASREASGLAAAELEAGEVLVFLVGAPRAGSRDEAIGIRHDQIPALEVDEEVHSGHREPQLQNLCTDEVFEDADSGMRPDGMEELRLRLDPHGGQLIARGDADATHLVGEAVAVLPPSVRSELESLPSEVEGDPRLELVGEPTEVLKSHEEIWPQDAAAREVEGIYSRGQLPDA